jgi:integrase/recombinase XerD
VLARLGLRAQEVASLQLGDVDWRAAEVVIGGKGASRERLPLPSDVCVGGTTCDGAGRGAWAVAP